eukprot:5044072-Alexandrium_andersonii.AAC.1
MSGWHRLIQPAKSGWNGIPSSVISWYQTATHAHRSQVETASHDRSGWHMPRTSQPVSHITAHLACHSPSRMSQPVSNVAGRVACRNSG